MTAQIISFPQRGPFVVHVEREGLAWIVVCRDHGWLHSDQREAIADAETIADGFGVEVVGFCAAAEKDAQNIMTLLKINFFIYKTFVL